jgi:hypothetical protein
MREKRLLPDRFWAEALSIKPALRTNGKRREAENGPAAGSTRIYPDKSLFAGFQACLQDVTFSLSASFQYSCKGRLSAQEIIGDRQPDAESPIFSSHFLVNPSQKNGFFHSLWFVKIRQASPSKK